ncbi:MAG: glycerophosphodiester phosphodiesterase family protein [Propionibacteriaceae bacterium]
MTEGSTGSGRDHAPTGLSRRALLGGGLATLLLGTGCQPIVQAAPAITVEALVKERPFHIAYRGGAQDWPEMTAYAYQQAAALPGLKALDVSVCLSADGVLVCSFDENLKRLTGKDLTIGSQDWATLSQLQVTAKYTSDPRQPKRPLARLEEVMEAHLDQFVIFVEPRLKEATGNLMATLIGLGRPERIVWKQPVTSPRFLEAKRHGFSTLGYVLDEPAHLGVNLSRYAAAPEIDLMGFSRRRNDAFISTVVKAARSQQKPLVSWDVTDPAQRARLLGLGCMGIASSDIKALLAAPVPAKELPPAER